MLRLFPRSWFKAADPASRRHAGAVAMLQAHWRQSLVAAVAHVVSATVASPEEAILVLMASGAPQLLALDQVLRRGSRFTHGSEVAPRRDKPTVISIDGERPQSDAYLFVASANPNGFIREQALTAFHHYPGRLAMAAALIRCDDWVPQVQQAASALLVRLTKEGSGVDIFAFLELLLLLRRRSRFAENIWPTEIEPALLSPTRREERWSATLRGNAESRWFAFKTVLHADPDRIDSALVRAVADGHPGVALWALEQSAASQDILAIRNLLALARRHRRGPVRSEVLRREVALDQEGAHERLREALFDPARGPRNAAAFLLRRDFQESALNVWRDTLDRGLPGRAAIALAALSEHADSSDHARLVPCLAHSNAQLRVLALRGLARTKNAQSLAHFVNALMDPAPRVVRQAIQTIAESGATIDRSWLEGAWKSASNPRSRSLLIRAARLLGKWETLDVLLHWSHAASDDVRVLIKPELSRWLESQNRNFAPLDEAVRSRLTDLAMATQTGRRDIITQRVIDALRPL